MAMESAKQVQLSAGPTKLFETVWSRSTTPDAARRACLVALVEVIPRELTPLAVTGYLAVLEDLTPAQTIRAFAQALETCRYFPSPGELRSLSGRPSRAVEEAAEALTELGKIVAMQKVFGIELLPIPGEVIRTKDDDGLVLQVPERGPQRVPPDPPAHVIRTVEDIGAGSYGVGLTRIASYATQLPDDPASQQRAIASRDAFERRWVQAYTNRSMVR